MRKSLNTFLLIALVASVSFITKISKANSLAGASAPSCVDNQAPGRLSDGGSRQKKDTEISVAEKLAEIKTFVDSGFKGIEKKDWPAALTDFTKAINLFKSLDKTTRADVEQSDGSIIGTFYSQRGLCKYRLGDTAGAEKDWEEAEKAGGLDRELVREAKNELTVQEANALVADFANELNRNATREFAFQEQKRAAANMALKSFVNETLNYAEQKAREYNDRKMEELRLRVEEEKQKNLAAVQAMQEKENERLRLEKEKILAAEAEANAQKASAEAQAAADAQAAAQAQAQAAANAQAQAAAQAQAQAAANAQAQAAAQAQAQVAAAAPAKVYGASVIYVSTDFPEGSKYPCGTLPGYQIWTQRVRYGFRNPNNFRVRIEFKVYIYVPGDKPLSFTQAAVLFAKDDRDDSFNYEIGCWLHNPGKFAVEVQIINTKKY